MKQLVLYVLGLNLCIAAGSMLVLNLVLYPGLLPDEPVSLCTFGIYIIVFMLIFYPVSQASFKIGREYMQHRKFSIIGFFVSIFVLAAGLSYGLAGFNLFSVS